MENNINLPESQIRQLVREEAMKAANKIILKHKISAIEKEIEKLSEVHAGGNMNPGADGVHAGQKKAVFTKKGTHLVEKEEEEETAPEDMEMGQVDAPSEEMPTEVPAEMGMETSAEESPEMGMSPEMGGDSISKEEIKSALMGLGQQLNLDGVINFTPPADEMGDGMAGSDEMGVDVTTGAEDAEGSEDPTASVEVPSDEPETDIPSGDGDESADDENIDECGNPKTEMNESKKPNNKLNEELNRLKFLAGIR